MADVTWPIVIGAAAIDSINPCAFGVLIFMITYMSKVVGDTRKMLINGLIYIGAVFITYILAGLVLLKFIQSLTSFSVITYYVIGGIIILAGLIEIKDYFWYGKWFSLAIMPSEKERIKNYINKIAGTKKTAFGLGVFVALVELPCTGAVYLAVLAIMAKSGLALSNMVMLLIYNIIFVLPLIIILLGAYKGMSTVNFKLWLEKNKKLMRLIVGLLLIGLGVWMIYFRGF